MIPFCKRCLLFWWCNDGYGQRSCMMGCCFKFAKTYNEHSKGSVTRLALLLHSNAVRLVQVNFLNHAITPSRPSPLMNRRSLNSYSRPRCHS